jgi:hypothetical protein
MRRSYEGDKIAQENLKMFSITDTCTVLDETTLQKHWISSLSQIPDLALGVEMGAYYENSKQRSARLAPARKRLKSLRGAGT